jgi:hypothetical protein
MIQHRIPEYMGDCPDGWRNFIEDLRGRVRPDENNGYLESTLQSELLKFNAVWTDHSPRGAELVFDDEKLYTVFVLKYGLL